MREIPDRIDILAKSRTKKRGLQVILPNDHTIISALQKAPIFSRRSNVVTFGKEVIKTDEGDRFYKAILNPYDSGIILINPLNSRIIAGDVDCMIVAKCQKDGSDLNIDTIDFFGQERFKMEFTEIER